MYPGRHSGDHGGIQWRTQCRPTPGPIPRAPTIQRTCHPPPLPRVPTPRYPPPCTPLLPLPDPPTCPRERQTVSFPEISAGGVLEKPAVSVIPDIGYCARLTVLLSRALFTLAGHCFTLAGHCSTSTGQCFTSTGQWLYLNRAVVIPQPDSG